MTTIEKFINTQGKYQRDRNILEVSMGKFADLSKMSIDLLWIQKF